MAGRSGIGGGGRRAGVRDVTSFWPVGRLAVGVLRAGPLVDARPCFVLGRGRDAGVVCGGAGEALDAVLCRGMAVLAEPYEGDGQVD